MLTGFEERILPFGKYFSTTFKVGTKKFGKIFVSFLFWLLMMLIITAICCLIIAVVSAPYLPQQIVNNPEIILSLTQQDVEYIVSLLMPMWPALIGVLLLFAFLSSIAANVFSTSVYLITDAYIKGKKRSMGSIIGYSFKRSVPLIGTSIWVSLFFLLITLIFSVVVALIALPSLPLMLNYATILDALASLNFPQIQASFEVIISGMAMWQLIAYGVVYLLFIFFNLYFSLTYMFSANVRMRYKVHGIKSMSMSRRLTKKKRGKLFGNILLFAIIMGFIHGVLSTAAYFTIQNGVPYVHYAIGLITLLLSFFTVPFASVMFVNFDMARGLHLTSSMSPTPKCVQDDYFIRRDHDGAMRQYAPQAPVQSNSSANQASVNQGAPVNEIIEQLEMDFDNMSNENKND